MDQLGIEECLGMVLDVVYQGKNQILRLSAARADKDAVPGMDMREDLIF